MFIIKFHNIIIIITIKEQEFVQNTMWNIKWDQMKRR